MPVRKSTTTNNTTIEFHKDKETKGTIVYKEIVDGDGYAHTFYIKKDVATALGNPEKIIVTIEAN